MDPELESELKKMQEEMDAMNKKADSIAKKDATPEVQLVDGQRLFTKSPNEKEKKTGRVVTYNSRIVDYPLPPEWQKSDRPVPTTLSVIQMDGTGTICTASISKREGEK